APDHGRQDERPAPAREIVREREDVGVHALGASAFAAWIASQTFALVSGMSMLRTPSGHSASITAFTNAAGDPTVADSPTPLAPIGWWGDGVTGEHSSNLGVSQAGGVR